MTRSLTITDYGKDYGYGRYFLVDSGRPGEDLKQIGSNDRAEIEKAVKEFMEEKEDGGGK